MIEGLIRLPWWGYVLVALIFTQITIAAVTLYLHRSQTHRALDLHPVVSHFFRFWLWITTSMVTKEWVAIHRKHHAKVETAEDPHSPQVHGISKVLWLGAVLYHREAANRQTLEQYGNGTPNDWLERRVYSQHVQRTGQVNRGRIDARRQFASVRFSGGSPHLGGADGVDPVLGRRRYQRDRALLGIP